MKFIKRISFILLITFFIFPLSSYSSRKKVIDDDEASLQRQQDLMEKRARAEAEIEARKKASELAEQERLEQERLEAERLEAERIAAEKEAELAAQQAEIEAQEAERKRLEEERLEAERIEKEKQEFLQKQMDLELENQKKSAAKNKK